ncbi:hypothetical protein RSOL_401200 [Rhizoctonia solani AG-3 Rhs1AP]|uniref:Uncharacterized protein n=1 Tax=Rhizoctonia solani AG-3 Rhs1AP TaxID=1086054 RepID=X8JC50_9AGAM|nr:hypothetical protein RSOL_401200 [Rhizoctonia solani AG-3 Rhs1AP]
MHAVTWTS